MSGMSGMLGMPGMPGMKCLEFHLECLECLACRHLGDKVHFPWYFSIYYLGVPRHVTQPSISLYNASCIHHHHFDFVVSTSEHFILGLIHNDMMKTYMLGGMGDRIVDVKSYESRSHMVIIRVKDVENKCIEFPPKR